MMLSIDFVDNLNALIGAVMKPLAVLLDALAPDVLA